MKHVPAGLSQNNKKWDGLHGNMELGALTCTTINDLATTKMWEVGLLKRVATYAASFISRTRSRFKLPPAKSAAISERVIPICGSHFLSTQ